MHADAEFLGIEVVAEPGAEVQGVRLGLRRCRDTSHQDQGNRNRSETRRHTTTSLTRVWTAPPRNWAADDMDRVAPVSSRK